MRVFKKVTAIAAALALLGGQHCHAGYWTTLTLSQCFAVSYSAASIGPFRSGTEAYNFMDNLCHTPTYLTAHLATLTIEHWNSTTTSTSTAKDPKTGKSPKKDAEKELPNTEKTRYTKIAGDLVSYELLDNPRSLLAYMNTLTQIGLPDTSALQPDTHKLLRPFIAIITEIYNVLKDSRLIKCATGQIKDTRYDTLTWDELVEEVISNSEAAPSPPTPPWQTQKCQLAAHTLVENPVLGSYSAVQIMACFPDCTLVPKNVKITFGLSLTGDEQKEIPPCIQANHAIIHIRQLRGANEFGYFYVDVEGTDQENPVRPFTIRKNIPKKVLRYLEARY